MVHSRRRHGLYPYEFGPVFRAVKYRLIQLLENREHFNEAEALFKVLWRFIYRRVGRPQYPEEVNWGLMDDFINGPLQPIEDISDAIVEKEV